MRKQIRKKVQMVIQLLEEEVLAEGDQNNLNMNVESFQEDNL